jgi:microcystin-dependent protein
MGEWFLGEIRLFPYTRIPTGWRICDGTILTIGNKNNNENAALFSLIGNQFGGEAKDETFALPDLRGRVPIGLPETSPTVGIKIGSEAVTLSVDEMPTHSHEVIAVGTPGTQAAPTGAFPAQVASTAALHAPAIYGSSDADLTLLSPDTIDPAGGSEGHENRQPTMALVYCIATSGLYPPRP